MTQAASVTAAVLIIGDEILSGRTKDQNISYIADYLSKIGIDLREARVVPDVTAEIVAAVNALRPRYDYLFTTGGIGPTHDDITADAIAAALGVEISEDPRVIYLLLERIKPEDLNEARRRMARIPHGAELVKNRISAAPGFWIGNVIVMAGVPAIMRAMLDEVGRSLRPHAGHRRDDCGGPSAGGRLCGTARRNRRRLPGAFDRLLSGFPRRRLS